MTSFRKWIIGALIFLGAFSLAIAAQCAGVTRAGVRCKNPAAAGSNFCHYHDPVVKHCAAKNKDGSACRNSPQPGSIYCHVHNK